MSECVKAKGEQTSMTMIRKLSDQTNDMVLHRLAYARRRNNDFKLVIFLLMMMSLNVLFLFRFHFLTINIASDISSRHNDGFQTNLNNFAVLPSKINQSLSMKASTATCN